jgi:hypothetical protein
MTVSYRLVEARGNELGWSRSIGKLADVGDHSPAEQIDDALLDAARTIG